jgi:hypothetical protein
MLNRFFDKKPGTISGISNYCDRWCERCPFTAQCGSFRFRTKLEALFKEELGDDESGRPPLVQANIQIMDLDSNLPEEAFTYETDSLSDTIEEAKQSDRDRKVREHPLTRLSDNYSDEILDIIKARDKDDFLDGIRIEPDLAKQLGRSPDSDLFTILADHHPAILQLSILVYVKTTRAIGNWYELLEEGDPLKFTKNDMNGTAKLVLVVIDELLEEWMKLRSTQPAFEAKANQLFDDLLKLREMTEEQFPQARAFKRPGLDK